MTTDEFARIVSEFVDAFSEDNYAMNCVRTLAESYDELRVDIHQLPFSSTQANIALTSEGDHSIRNAILGSVDQTMHHTHLSTLHDALRLMIDKSAVLESNYPTLFTKLSTEIERFRSVLDTFHRRPIGGKPDPELAAGSLMYSALLLYEMIVSRREMLAVVSEALRPNPEPNDDQERLRLTYFDEPTLENVSLRLAALARLYAWICSVLEIDVVEHPLEIVKVETGSTDIDVLGIGAAIKTLVKVLDDFIRPYTPSGRMEIRDAEREQLRADAALRDEFKARGFDTSRSDQLLHDRYEGFFSDVNAVGGNVGRLNDQDVNVIPAARLSLSDVRHDTGDTGPRIIECDGEDE